MCQIAQRGEKRIGWSGIMKDGVYLVLGGSGGIGSEVARTLAASGARVMATGRDSGRLEALAGAAEVATLSHDARNFEEVEAAVSQTVERFGRLDGAVNCVGSLLLKPLQATSPEEFDDVVRTSLYSAFNLLKAAGAPMRKEGGSVVLVSSAAAGVGMRSHEAIAAAKAGIEGLARSAAASYARNGIRVNAVAPGLTETPLTEHMTTNEARRKASESAHPLGRLGAPKDIAAAICWLLDQTWITGQVLGVDGGLARVRSL
jgi:NAD(P)-dependent dehydrogenase (short-subunit alcohol dehydrogenase family)